MNIGLSGNCINAICANDRSIIAGTDNGVFITIDNGNIWTDVSSGLPVVRTYALLQDRENLFIGTYFGGVFLSSDNGLTWIEMNSGLNPYIGSILFPLDTVLPQFAESFSKYDAAPIVNQKTGQIAKPFIDLTAVAQKERDVIAYESGEFPEVIMLQLTGHVTGKVKE